MRVKLANYDDMRDAERGVISSDEVRRAEVDGVVDTGASRLVLPKNVAEQLGLRKSGTTRVRYADQRSAKRDVVRYVWLELLGRDGVFSATVEPKRTTALLGAIVLEELDMVADCVTGTCHPRDPNEVITEIE